MRETKSVSIVALDSPSRRVTISDCNVSQGTTGRCENGSDEKIASSELAERAAIKGIGKIEAIDNVHLEVALTQKA